MDDDLDLSFEPANPNAIDPLLSVSLFTTNPNFLLVMEYPQNKEAVCVIHGRREVGLLIANNHP